MLSVLKRKGEETKSKNYLQQQQFGVTMKKPHCYVDISGMDDFLSETDKNTQFTMAWVALRNQQEDEECLADDDSLAYLSDAVSDFFRKVCFCNNDPTSTITFMLSPSTAR